MHEMPRRPPRIQLRRGKFVLDSPPLAFEELVRLYSPGVYQLALGILHRPAEAEEVLQETFLTAYRKLAEVREPERLKSWLYRVASNHALMRLRSERRHPEEPLPESLDLQAWEADPEELYAREELRATLSHALERLAPAYRSVFWLRDVEGLPAAEVAELLGLTVAAVKSRLLRARLQLREELAQEMNRHA